MQFYIYKFPRFRYNNMPFLDIYNGEPFRSLCAVYISVKVDISNEFHLIYRPGL